MMRMASGTSVSRSDMHTGCHCRRMASPIGVPGPAWVSSGSCSGIPVLW